MREYAIIHWNMRMHVFLACSEKRGRAMLNDRKVRLMTKLAMYEGKEGKQDIKLSKYYKTDYARLQVLKTGITVTFAYILLLAMYVLYNLEYFIEDAVIIEWAELGKKALGIYLAIMTVYLIFTLVGFSIRYSISRKKLSKYFRMLRKLRTMYREEGEEVDPEEYDDSEDEALDHESEYSDDRDDSGLKNL